MEELVLTAVIQELPESEGGGYWAFVEELPGAITQADTLEEIRTNLQDAVSLVLQFHREQAKSQLSPEAKRTIRERIHIPA